MPILALTFWGPRYSSYELRQIVEEVNGSVRQVENVSEITIIGGTRRELRIMLDPQCLAGYQLSPAALVCALEVSNQQGISGTLVQQNREALVETGRLIDAAEDAQQLVVGEGKPQDAAARGEVRLRIESGNSR